MDFENLRAGLICMLCFVPYMLAQRKCWRARWNHRTLIASLPLPVFALYGLGPFFMDLSRMKSWDAIAIVYAFAFVTGMISAAWTVIWSTMGKSAPVGAPESPQQQVDS